MHFFPLTQALDPMFPISDSVINAISYGGVVALVLGCWLACISIQHWDALPNYQRMIVAPGVHG